MSDPNRTTERDPRGFWITPEIQSLIDGDLTPRQMSVDQLVIAARPIANGTADLGFVAEYGSAIAAAFLKFGPAPGQEKK